ncbi:MAG: amidohydrolase [Ramlibacter sp.]|nr:amidohydrolase [Ramlibacter sp.]
MTMLDAHQHVWTIGRHDYFWLKPGLAIHRDYALDDLRPLLGGVTGTVLVQAAPCTEETDFLLAVAQASGGLVRGVVGWVDLAAPAAPDAIAALAARPLVKGVRPMLGFIEETGWILRPELRTALDALERAGLSLDVPARPRHLPLLVELAQRHPALAMVIDHGAKPAIAQGGFAPWAHDIARVARETPAFCKLSGLATEASALWDDEELQPYVEHLLECFGPQRLMWGSDWPVVDLAGGFVRWREACLRMVPPALQEAVMGETARTFYRLGTPPDH